MPAMRSSLDATLVQAQWVSNAYMLTISSLILVGGAVGDRFGLARVFGAGITVFVLASLVCAVAPSPEILIAARALQGIGAATMIPGSLALISRIYPPEQRGKAIGLWATAAAVTSALGPIIGGIALTAGGPETWRWVFAVNLPLGGLALFLLYRHIEQDPSQPDRGIDFPGGGLAILGLGVFAAALTGAEHGQVPETEAVLLALLGLVIFGGFVYVERKSPHPMMPLRIFQHRGFSAANFISFLIYFSFSAVLFYLPMLVIGSWGATELTTAAAFVPLSVFIAALSTWAGHQADRIGPAPLLTSGALVLAIGYGLLAYLIPTMDFWLAVMPAMILQGVGMGLVVAPLQTAIMGTVDSRETGTASGINNAVTRIAGLVAVAAMGSAVAISYTATGGPDSFGTISQTAGHVSSSNAAFITVAWSACAFTALASILSWLLLPRPPSSAKAGKVVPPRLTP